MTDRLTPQERRCVSLAGEGLSNKAIRARLGMGSDRTVARHLANAYRKLGVANRTDAARLLHNEYADRPTIIPKSNGAAASSLHASGFDTNPVADLQRGTRGLLAIYSALGTWRTPPRWGGFRIGPLVMAAVIWIVGLGLVSQSLRSCAEFVDTVRGRPLTMHSGAPNVQP